MHELETKIKHMEQAHKQESDRLLETNQNLMSLIQKLEAEIAHLKSKTISSINTPSMSISTPESAADNVRSDYSGSPRSEDRIRDPDAMDISTGPQDEVSTAQKSSLGSRHCGSGCHTTKDGVSFCEKLKDEVCSSAYERLLSESIFDTSGQVNNAIEPVPIVTTPIGSMEHSKDRHNSKFSTFRRNFLPDSPEEEDSDEYDLASGTSDAFKHEPHPVTMQPGKQLITCSQVWERLCEHPQFEDFDIDELCTQLKLKAKCSGSGPVIEEDELHEVLEALESKLAQDSRR